MNKEPQLESPRWPNGPPICAHRNAPAFANEQEAALYLARFCPSYALQKISLCPDCGLWHYKSKANDARGDGAPAGFTGFLRSETRARIASYRSSGSTAQPELAAAPVPTAKWDGPWCVKCEWPVKGGKCTNSACETRAKPLPKRTQEGSWF